MGRTSPITVECHGCHACQGWSHRAGNFHEWTTHDRNTHHRAAAQRTVIDAGLIEGSLLTADASSGTRLPERENDLRGGGPLAHVRDGGLGCTDRDGCLSCRHSRRPRAGVRPPCGVLGRRRPLFYTAALDRGIFTIFDPYGGYLVVGNRLLAIAESVMPPAYAPLLGKSRSRWGQWLRVAAYAESRPRSRGPGKSGSRWRSPLYSYRTTSR